MSEDNGKDIPVIKTEAELDAERAARFTAEPHSFIEINELICGAIRNPKSPLGISILVGNCKRSELNQAQVELNHRMEIARRQMDIEAEVNKQSKIIPAKHGMFDFARRK